MSEIDGKSRKSSFSFGRNRDSVLYYYVRDITYYVLMQLEVKVHKVSPLRDNATKIFQRGIRKSRPPNVILKAERLGL